MTFESATERIAYQPTTLDERVALGMAAGRVHEREIVPFPPEWGTVEDLATSLPTGPTKTHIFQRLNQGWRLTLHRYSSPAGAVIMIVLRLHAPDRPEKFVRPLHVHARIGIKSVVAYGSLGAPRPLYALEELCRRDQAPVLMVEGEKAADAAQARFPDFVVSTWLHGVGGIAATDLRPLIGRAVTIWPDNDEPGRRAASRLAAALVRIGVDRPLVVQVPPGFPAKWDLADPAPEGCYD